MGLVGPPPDFYHWSLYGQNSLNLLSVKEALTKTIAFTRPLLFIVDPMRAFFPRTETGGEETTTTYSFQRGLSKKYGCAWADLHHMRKRDKNPFCAPDLADDPMTWLQEAAGSRALVNNSDLRLGIEAVTSSLSGADLLVGGFRRGAGKLPAFLLGRVFDEGDEPMGYELLTGVSTLNIQHQNLFTQLGPSFRFKDVREQLGGKSDSAAAKFLEACLQAQVICAEGEHKKKHYNKVNLDAPRFHPILGMG
jgi:hypothetical protein